MTKSHLHRRRAARRTGYDEGFAAGEAERNNLKGKNQSIVVLLNAARRRIQEIFDHLDDEGDRVYLGSTNHRDWLRDMLDHMDRWSFDAILPKGDINKMEADPYAEIRTQRARAEAAEAEVKQLIAKRESPHGLAAAKASCEPIAYLRPGEETFVQNVPFGAMWISEKDDPRAFPVYDRPQEPARSVAVKAKPEALEQFTAYFVKNYPGPDTVIFDPKWHAPKIFRAVVSALSAQVQDVAQVDAETEDADCCIACEAPLVAGDLVYWDVSDTGYLHAGCCGPERESYVNEDGEPLKDGDPIPQPFPYKPDRAAGYIYTGGEKE